ncbi:MAG: hypothetical protein ACF8XB_15660 [Planctomycetota bacterium JB042]
MRRLLVVLLPVVVAACVHGTLSWSLDGRRFAFSGLLEDDRGESDRGGLYVFDLDERSVTRPVVTDVRLSTPLFLDDDRILFAGPSSSDAPTLILSTVDRTNRRRRPLCLLRLRGPAPVEDVETSAGMIVPTASEDRTRVAFNVIQPHAPPTIVVVDLLDKMLRILPVAGLFPVLTSDGRRVSFLALPGDGTSVRTIGEGAKHELKGLIDLTGETEEEFGYGETRISGLAVYDLDRNETDLAVRWKGKLDAPHWAVSRDRKVFAVAGRRGVLRFDLDAGIATSILEDEELLRVTFDRDDRSLLAVCAGRSLKDLEGALVRVTADGEVGRVFGGPSVPRVAAFGVAPDRRTFATVHTNPKVRDPFAVVHDLSLGTPTDVLLPDDLDSATELVMRWSDRLGGADETELRIFDLAFKTVGRRVDVEVPADDPRRGEYAARMARAKEGRFRNR